MTAMQRVRRARSVLAAVMLLGTVAWSLAAGLIVLVGARSLAALGGQPGLAGIAWLACIVAALGTAAVLLWKGHGVWSLERVALWIEERAPDLKYALVTLVDERYADTGAGIDVKALDTAARRADVDGMVWGAARRTLVRVGAATLLAGSALWLNRAFPELHSWAPSADGPPVRVLPNRLAGLRAEVIFPAYTGLPSQLVSNPTSVVGLEGSKVRFFGEGPAHGITVEVPKDTAAKDTLAAEVHERGWAIPMTMPNEPGIARFHDRHYTASVMLEPQVDSVPRLFLRRPAKDTTYHPSHPPRGSLVLEADIEDDFGIGSAFFEVLVSTGGAESFETKDYSTSKIAFQGQRRGTLSATLNYAALGVGPGTVLHIRAVAFDLNNLSRESRKGVSETRTIRIATKQEYDTSSVTPAPPLPIDTLYVSQRLLNARTDTLIRIRKRVLPESLIVDTSIVYGNVQTDIRQRVENVIQIAEDDGVGGRVRTPISRLLRAASEQMYLAFTLLAIGEPDEAYAPRESPMKEALRLLEEAKKAQKYYVRGVLAARPVDVAKSRLQGKDTASAADRHARVVPEDLRRGLQARLASIVPLAMQSPAESVDSLLAVWVAAARAAPAVGAAIKEAIALARESKDISLPLARARRLLDAPSKVAVGPYEWGGMLP